MFSKNFFENPILPAKNENPLPSPVYNMEKKPDNWCY